MKKPHKLLCVEAPLEHSISKKDIKIHSLDPQAPHEDIKLQMLLKKNNKES